MKIVMKIKNRALSLILSAALMLAPLTVFAADGGEPESESGEPEDALDTLAGTPFTPDIVNGLRGITYILHTAGAPGFTDESIAVLEIAPNASARLLAGVPHYDYLQGFRTVCQMARAYTERGYDVIAAINGGFFGLTNPAGTQVINQGVLIRHGELLRHWEPLGSNEYIGQEHYIIGTLKDGGFFHGHNPLHIMHISVNGGYAQPLNALQIQSLNSPRSAGNPNWRDLTLLTERFGETALSPPDRLAGLDVMLEVVSGRMAFGEELVMRVVQAAGPAEYNAAIGAGRAILTAANSDDMEFLSTLREGDVITVSNSFINRRGTDVDWAYVDQAVPAHFKLIKNGEPQPLPGRPGALEPLYPEITPNPETTGPLPLLPSQNIRRPRTGVGVRADGAMVWVVVSGSFNSGMTMSEFQDYLISLDLEYAWNFDGGASSAMVIGETPVSYVHGPGSAFRRPVANGLVLVSPPLADNTVEITVQPWIQRADTADFADFTDFTDFTEGSVSGSLSVRARSSAGTLNFQWYRDGEATGADSPVFEIPEDLAEGYHEFHVVVSAGTAAPQISDTVRVTVSAPPPTPPSIPFVDVHCGDWFAGYVMFAYENGLMSGTGTDPMRFSPNMPLTRGTLVTALYRHAGAPDVSGFANPFSDVPEGRWYAGAAVWAANNGIVQGLGGGIFAPERSITREEIAVIMFRYANSAGKPLPYNPGADGFAGFADFADKEAVSEWAGEAAEIIRRAGVIVGRPGNLFDPQGSATRAEAAAILRRFSEHFPAARQVCLKNHYNY